MRRAGSIALNVVFLLAFAGAPFDHFHSHGEQDHPHGGFLHGHVPHAAAPTSVEFHDFDPDDDAQPLDWFHLVPAPELSFVAVLVPVATLSVAWVEEQIPELTEPRGHDPPSASQASPRSPPA